MIVIAEKYGQLGNRLFVFAHFIAAAAEHGLKVSNPSFDEYAEFFESTRRDPFCRYPAGGAALPGARRLRGPLYAAANRLTNVLGYRSPNNRFWEVIRIREGETYDLGGAKFVEAARGKWLVLVQGWLFRDEPRLQKHAGAIREFFAPAEPFAGNVAAHLGKARAGCDVLVGIHIRQGDYRNFLGGRYFYQTEQYVRLMRGIERLFEGRRVGFLVCSNAAHEAGHFEGLRHTFGTGHVLEDMYSLAGCDYIMGPPSTYTLWASFYGRTPLYSVESPDAEISRGSFRVA